MTAVDRKKFMEEMAKSPLNMKNMPVYTYDYPRPMVSVDVIAILRNKENNYDPDHAKLVLIRRATNPEKGKMALPGGFVEENETTEEAAARELKEETGIEVKADELVLFGVYSKVNRDPRGRNISICYLTYIDFTEAKAGDEACGLFLDISIREAAKEGFLAFDHSEILGEYI